MANITITINTDNSVFEEKPKGVKELLEKVAIRLDMLDFLTYESELSLFDENGNEVGKLIIAQ